MSTQYASRAAAEHAAKVLRVAVPQSRVEIERGYYLVVWCYPETLTPSQRSKVEPHEVRRPAAPTPAVPLLPPAKKRPKDQWKASTVKNPAAVCTGVMDGYRALGKIDDRLEILADLIERGVTPNTAKTYYARYREAVGLPKSVRDVRRRTKTRSKAQLMGRKPPIGRRVQNGQVEPVDGTVASEVWAVAAAMHRKHKRPIARREVAEKLPTISIHSIQRYLQDWRKFHAIKAPER